MIASQQYGVLCTPHLFLLAEAILRAKDSIALQTSNGRSIQNLLLLCRIIRTVFQPISELDPEIPNLYYIQHPLTTFSTRATFEDTTKFPQTLTILSCQTALKITRKVSFTTRPDGHSSSSPNSSGILRLMSFDATFW